MADVLRQLAATAPPAETILFGPPTFVVVGTAASGANTATVTAKANQQHFLTSLTLSYGATITAAHTLTVSDGSTVIYQVEIPTITSPSPIHLPFDRPLHASTNTALVAAITTPGTIASAISLSGFSVMAP